MWILIGAPIFKREWILSDWFAAIEKQSWPMNQLGFIFEGAPNDQETIDLLFDYHAKHPELRIFDVAINNNVRHTAHQETGRSWNGDRYATMVQLRNSLLARVRCHRPDFYFSLDTDILLEDSNTIQILAEVAQPDAAASPLLYMTPKGCSFPSVMTWAGKPGGRAYRANDSYPIGETFKADVIMAAKMMSQSVYENVNYQWHQQGEDLGWSANAAHLGYDLYSVSGVYAPHIMEPIMLKEHREKGDSRKQFLQLL